MEQKNEASTISAGTGALHFDDNKPDVADIDPEFILGIGYVLTYGRKKYERDNWRKGGEYRRFIASIMRHTLAIAKGEYLDLESGLPHTHHLATDTMFMDHWLRNGLGTDDRFGTSRYAQALQQFADPTSPAPGGGY